MLGRNKNSAPLLDDNHVVVGDNGAFHKSEKTKELITAKDTALLFLPPYSSDLNPMEHAFATIKRFCEYNEQETLKSYH